MPLTLTDEQSAIVHAPNGHYVISAVAGSGKTTTLAHRIGFLLQQGVVPKRILILMFNRSAREDFQRKLSQTLKLESHHTPEVRTFHALGYRLYQRFVQDGFLAPFNSQILSEKEQDLQIWRLLHRLLDDDQVKDLKRNKKEHLEICRLFIEQVKTGLKDAQLVFELLDLDKKFAYLPELFSQFEQWRKQEARISYSDMLYDTVKAIKQRPELQALVGNKMEVVLVDEYQDTNDIQHELLKYIAGERAKITVVGDPDQTIYEFRGAKPDYILKGFADDFPDASLLTLSYSFRYGHAVSLLANHLIAHNQNRLPLICKSHHANPNTQIHLHQTANEEQTLIAQLQILTPEDYSQAIILTRVWSQTVSIELALLEAGLAYQIEGHGSVFHSTELKAIRALLGLSAGLFPAASTMFRQQQFELIFQFPHIGLPEVQLRHLAQLLANYPEQYGEQLLQLIPADLKKFQQLKLERLARILSQIESNRLSGSQILQRYAQETELFDGIRALSFHHDQAEERVRSTKSLISFISRQAKDASSLLIQLDELARKAQNQGPVAIKITTIHRAKGLEWSHVYIPGFNQRNLPYSLRSESLSPAELESERRLLYVAMTRAKAALHLFAPSQTSAATCAPSCFQDELNFKQSKQLATHLYTDAEHAFCPEGSAYPSKLIIHYAKLMNCPLSLPEKRKPGKHDRPHKTTDKTLPETLGLGRQVLHCLLGTGKVIEERHSAFTVEFENRDKRTFSKEFAGRFFTLPEA